MKLVYYLFLTHFIFQSTQISKFIVHTTGFNFVVILVFFKVEYTCMGYLN